MTPRDGKPLPPRSPGTPRLAPHAHRRWVESHERRLAQEPDRTARNLMRANLDALAAFVDLAGSASPAQLRKRAALVVRCDDCAGRWVAVVVWIRERPLLVGSNRGGEELMTTVYLDAEVFADGAGWCRQRQHRLGRAELMGATPGPGSPQVTVRVSHGSGGGLR